MKIAVTGGSGKLGRTVVGVREALRQSGRLADAVYVERASTGREVVRPVAEVDPDAVPYFSSIVVPGRGPSFGARTSVSISLTHRRIGSRAKLAVTVANANAFALSGSIAGRSRHTRPPNRLAAKRFAVAARGRTHLAFTLSRRLRSRLTRTGALAVVLTARVTDPAGHTRHVARTLTPRLKRARR